MKHIHKRHVPYLSCHPNAGGPGCTGILLLETERFVVDELDKPEFLDAIAADGHGARRDAITPPHQHHPAGPADRAIGMIPRDHQHLQ